LTTAERYRNYRGPALFSMGFRPFFLFASAWAALAVPIWIAAFAGLLNPSQFTRDWHVHEMLFGYLSGVIAGFLLTAVPNWTGRLPVTGASLAALFGLWVAGRLAMLLAAPLGALAAVVDSAFLFVLAAIIAREVLAGKNLRNLPVCVLVSVLAVANVLSHMGVAEAELARLGERIGLGVVAMLVTVIGGRIVPSFTRNWMAKRGLAAEPAAMNRYDALTIVVTGVSLAAWIAMPASFAAGAALTAAGAFNLVRLLRWRGWMTTAEPLVFILHAGYFWLAAGLGLLGLAIVAPAHIPNAAGMHALTAGAFGVMTLAVMTRASLGHTGRPLTASPSISLIYLLVNLGAAVRTASPFFPDAYLFLLAIAALAWSGAFAVFVAVYAPLLLRPRRAAG
jgi:uncharacterized protein involved in response to NO